MMFAKRRPLGERAEPSVARKSLQAALDDYPNKGSKIDYQRVSGVRKAAKTKNKKPKRK
jgi:hypothetical protein